MVEFLYHHHDVLTGPFRNLSDLGTEEAKAVLNEIRLLQKGFASKRSADYLEIRSSIELKARELFIMQGGKPVRSDPDYMTIGKCPWLMDCIRMARSLEYYLSNSNQARSVLPMETYFQQ